VRSTGLAYIGIFVIAFTAFLQGASPSTSSDSVTVVSLDHPAHAASQADAPPFPPEAPKAVPAAPVPSATGLVRAASPRYPDLPGAPAPGDDGDTPASSALQERTQERTQERVVRDDGDDRSRWRRRDRFPGPWPGPEDWQPPEGPVKIALQAGHWRSDEAPRELSGLRGNGTRWQNMAEWEANLAIAREAGAQLEELGYEVDILPAVVPPGYRAHLFISIHADGSGDPRASGYRVAAPGRDATGRADGLVTLLERSYGDATGLRRIPTVTRRMRNYYAFNYRRYEHALHPMTIGVILETGFLTSADDRQVIVGDPARAARGIVEAVKAFPETPPPLVAVEAGAEARAVSGR
jgi:N-acetylmuramoyl-L-alanine amidase